MNRAGNPGTDLPRSCGSIAFVLPSLDPDESILELAEKLHAAVGDTFQLLVVDDGSRAEKQEIFTHLAEKPYCTVLHHPVNLGKGAALKTAFRYLLNDAACIGCVTADGDGQHLPEDILRTAARLRAQPDALILGCRVFSGGRVPWKSRLGNRLTKIMFRAALRLPLADTQTGLRGVPTSFMKRCLAIPGDRFEFETQMLLETRNTGTPIVEIPIETVYFDANSGTHFRPLRDAVRIYGVIFRFLFGDLFRFVLSSLSARANRSGRSDVPCAQGRRTAGSGRAAERMIYS